MYTSYQKTWFHIAVESYWKCSFVCSLGGNCMTTMIATCSLEKKNIDVRWYRQTSPLLTGHMIVYMFWEDFVECLMPVYNPYHIVAAILVHCVCTEIIPKRLLKWTCTCSFRRPSPPVVLPSGLLLWRMKPYSMKSWTLSWYVHNNHKVFSTEALKHITHKQCLQLLLHIIQCTVLIL